MARTAPWLNAPLARLRDKTAASARERRANSTDADRRLWHHLRDGQLAGWKFHRQHPVGRFRVDFACVEAALIVELDGGEPLEPSAREADARRAAALREAGYSVLRFPNAQALNETAAVLEQIAQWLREKGSRASPRPPGRAGAKGKDTP